jgi:small subunit ribosomal protein S20
MANHKSAIKRIRQTEKRTAYNRMYRSRARTLVKKARIAIRSAADQKVDQAQAIATTRAALQDLDRAASRGVIHKNNAARRKSRLMKQLNTLLAKS